VVIDIVIGAVVVGLLLAGGGWKLFSPWTRSLVEHGAEGKAIVLECLISEAKYGTRFYDVKLEVHYDDGTTREISRSTQAAGLDRLAVGDIVPIRYDPKRHHRVELDRPAMRARHSTQAAQQDAAAIAQAESELGAQG
jgi:hypothetical protein